MIKTNQAFLKFITEYQQKTTESSHIRLRHFKSGERIIWQGDTGAELLIIAEGIAKCFISEENGRDYVLAFLGKGEIMGEIELILKSDNLSNIEALTDLETYEMSTELFHDLLRKNVAFNELILKEFAIRLKNTANKASYQQVFPIEYNVLKILFLWAQVSADLSKSDLADYLGIPIRSLNRVLKTLKEKGLIESSGNEIDILSIKGLENLKTQYF